MSDLFGVCRFCGQAIAVPVSIETQEDADAWASVQCDCGDGRELKKKTERALTAKEQVDELFGEGCEEFGFPQSYGASRISFLKGIVDAVSRGEIEGAKLDFGTFGKADISLTAKNTIKVGRSHGHKITLEA